MSYSHLTRNERICLGEFFHKGYSIRAIARMLGRAPSTISRELKRYTTKNGYAPYYAYSQAVHLRRMPRRSSLQLDPCKLQYVVSKLKMGWSPEQICNRWAKEHSGSFISASTIYRHAKRKLLPGIDVKKHFRRKGKRIVHKNSNYNSIHPDRLITQWPEQIQRRLRYGDWEGDLVFGAKGKGFPVSLVDRKTGFLAARVILNKDASTTRKAIVEALKGLPVHSISLDNGSEFAQFRELEKELHTLVYFAEPHKPWQRGTNENTNGIIRQYFPKGCDFRKVSQQQVQAVVDEINNRPRKRLDWFSPAEIFSVALA